MKLHCILAAKILSGIYSIERERERDRLEYEGTKNTHNKSFPLKYKLTECGCGCELGADQIYWLIDNDV